MSIKSILSRLIEKAIEILSSLQSKIADSIFALGLNSDNRAHYVDYNTFLMFGDSITEFAFNQFPDASNEIQFSLGAALQNSYTRKLQVLQRGFSGYTSRDAIPLIRSILKQEHDRVTESKKIKIAYVFFGTNDARLKGKGSNNQHIPINTYVSNIKTIVTEFKQRSIPVIVITPGFHDQNLWNLTHPEDLITGDYRENNTNKKYQDALKNSIIDTPVLCLYDEMEKWIVNNSKVNAKGGYSELLSDGIHFTGTGYKLLYDVLMKFISENYPESSPENLEYRFPHHSTLCEHTFDQIS